MEAKIQRGIVLMNDHCHPHYDVDFVTKLYTSEAGTQFDTRQQVLGYVQQGSRPTPFDRNLGIKFGFRAASHIIEQLTASAQSDGTINCTAPATIVGINGQHLTFTPVKELEPEVDLKNRRWKTQWFLRLRPLLGILANKDTTYIQEAH